MDDADIDKIIVSNKTSYKKGYEYFFGYKDDEKVNALCIMPPQMSARTRSFHETKCMSFLTEVNEWLEKYNKIWSKVSNSIQKDFDSKPAVNEKYLKTKLKSFEGKINTDFHDNGIRKESSRCICLSSILIDPVF